VDLVRSPRFARALVIHTLQMLPVNRSGVDDLEDVTTPADRIKV